MDLVGWLHRARLGINLCGQLLGLLCCAQMHLDMSWTALTASRKIFSVKIFTKTFWGHTSPIEKVISKKSHRTPQVQAFLCRMLVMVN